jgi:hypothetical protein
MREGYSPITKAESFDVQYNFVVLVFKLPLVSLDRKVYLYSPPDKYWGYFQLIN